jgi:hypothetical protein
VNSSETHHLNRIRRSQYRAPRTVQGTAHSLTSSSSMRARPPSITTFCSSTRIVIGLMAFEGTTCRSSSLFSFDVSCPTCG